MEVKFLLVLFSLVLTERLVAKEDTFKGSDIKATTIPAEKSSFKRKVLHNHPEVFHKNQE